MKEFKRKPDVIIQGKYKKIFSFKDDGNSNLDPETIKSFGKEWKKFHDFSEEDIEKGGDAYFDIVSREMIKSDSYVIDIGCGSGRWTKYLHGKTGFIEAIDPSSSIFSADELLKDAENVRLSQCSIDNIPFDDNTFEFALCLGVIHHLPNPQKALTDCVRKIKTGGYILLYVFYDLETRGIFYRLLFKIANIMRMIISRLPIPVKNASCDLIAVIIYFPLVLLISGFRALGLERIAAKLPLHFYHDKSFYTIRNDSLDRFGTPLEKRFSKREITTMMKKAGLSEITFSNKEPYYHAIGKRT